MHGHLCVRSWFVDLCQTTIKVAKYLQLIIIYAANKRLNLKNSPPYLHGIVTETGELIHNIFKKASIEELKANEYINIFVANLISHSKKTVKLFKDAKEAMEVCVDICGASVDCSFSFFSIVRCS